MKRWLLSAVTAAAIGGATIAAAHATSPHHGTGAVREPTEKEKDLLYNADQILQRRCLQRFGFKLWPVPRHPLPEDREFPYVIDDVTWAREHGYGSDMESRRAALRNSDPNHRYFVSLTPDQKKSMLAVVNGARPTGLEVRLPTGIVTGRSDRSCSAESDSRLYGDLKTWFRASEITESLTELRRRQVAGDPRYAASVAQWSRCMREKRFSYQNPYAARAAFLLAGNSKKAGQEMETAVAEAACAASSGLGATIHQLDGEYGAKLYRAYRSEVDSGHRIELAALPRARAIVTQG